MDDHLWLVGEGSNPAQGGETKLRKTDSDLPTQEGQTDLRGAMCHRPVFGCSLSHLVSVSGEEKKTHMAVSEAYPTKPGRLRSLLESKEVGSFSGVKQGVRLLTHSHASSKIFKASLLFIFALPRPHPTAGQEVGSHDSGEANSSAPGTSLMAPRKAITSSFPPLRDRLLDIQSPSR